MFTVHDPIWPPDWSSQGQRVENTGIFFEWTVLPKLWAAARSWNICAIILLSTPGGKSQNPPSAIPENVEKVDLLSHKPKIADQLRHSKQLEVRNRAIPFFTKSKYSMWRIRVSVRICAKCTVSQLSFEHWNISITLIS